VVASAVIQKGKNYFIVRQWTRMPERAKDDDNPGMGRYLGYGDFLFMRSGRNRSFSLLLRNNLRTRNNKGALQADWSFPLHRNLKGYMQYFTGYGETLIDYNRPCTRIGLGVALTDWI
jgi:phospholipase A1